MEDPESPSGAPIPASPPPSFQPPNFQAPSFQAAGGAAEDRIAESLALDDAIGNPAGPSALTSRAPRHSDSTEPDTGYGPPPPVPNGTTRQIGDGPEGEPGDKRRKTKVRRKAPWWELPLLIAIAVVVAMLIKTFLVQPYYIPSESMENTLYGCAGCSGDRILVNKPVYDIRDPHPGDIVVFKAPPHWDNEPVPKSPSNPVLAAIDKVGQFVGLVPPNENDIVKRVIAVGGQTVRCCDANGNIQVSDNGDAGPWHSLNEPYVFQNLPWTPGSAPSGSSTGPNGIDQRNFGPVTIPKGRLWVMGDHRSVSEDSRWHYTHDSAGDPVASTVPISSVIGKAVLIVWPPHRWRTLGTPATFGSAAASLGPFGPPLASGVLVAPIWLIRRRRRRT